MKIFSLELNIYAVSAYQDRQVFATSLKRVAREVITATSAEKALDAFKKLHNYTSDNAIITVRKLGPA